MSMPYISGLRADVWANSSPDERLQSLQSLEDHLAIQDGRETPCTVSLAALGEHGRGEHFFDANGVEHIRLNSNLVTPEEVPPYQAVETLFHEDRHAHQAHVVKHPELAESEEQLQDWQMSDQGGYIDPPETPETVQDQQEYFLDFSEYRWQPVEADANRAARQQTDELYQNTFNDDEGYLTYKADKEKELAVDQFYAQETLGENYEQEARQAMQAKYQAFHDMEQQADIGESGSEQQLIQETATEAVASPELLAAEKAGEAAGDAVEVAEQEAGVQAATPEAPEPELETPAEDNPANQVEETPSQDSSEGEDYSYGYGY